MPSPSIETQVPLDAEIWSVSELNTEVRGLLEDHFPSLWITGEISNFARPASGHLYFSLKDDRAEVRCAMFRGQNRLLKFDPRNGDQVIVRARVTVYEPRGSYQLIVDHMEPAGEGLLLRRLEELKTRLQAEGLFDDSRKQPLPALPRRIGVVTSPTGAAIRDILQILERRFPAVPVVIYPVHVQGDRAQYEIAAAIETAADRGECDVLIVGRGGGSLEDLWAFNEERVARAIFACPIPIVSAVGHEVDFTIADFVADLRAPTPSGAAELVVPDARQWLQAFEAGEQRMKNALGRSVAMLRRQLAQLAGRIGRRHPGLILQQHAQRLDELTQRMGQSQLRRLGLDRLRLDGIARRLRNAGPSRDVVARRQRLEHLHMRLAAAARKQLAEACGRAALLAAALDGVSPLKTLERGYAVITDAETGAVVRDAVTLKPGQRIDGRLARGHFEARIARIRKD
ncbi:MAG: exodeoxyribonuclease VII large subunit [Gammaproteobacteria bacterium]|nr:exodeoxyribonuclease VII large subunit [Gammaproteobacteria bacterium]NND37577.1 exodeoxyribonuclease VII large subunit [Gammaproteobacteria bacterium]